MVCIVFYFCIILLGGCSTEKQETQIVELTTNDRINPLGLDETVYFSWKMQDSEKGKKQSAYQILLSDSKEKLEKRQYIWDSGKVFSDKSVAISYEGIALEAEKEFFWKVVVWDEEQNRIESDVVSLETGKDKDQWENTEWITAGKDKVQHDFIEVAAISEISYDFRMEKTRTAFIMGTDDGQYGECYTWEIDGTGDQIKVVISHMDREKLLEPEEIHFLENDVEQFLDDKHTVRIIMQNEKATMFIDEKIIVQDFPMYNMQVEEIGLWTTRGQWHAWYDNIVVKNKEGEIYLWEDFQNLNNMFSPYYVKVENGMGRVDAGYLFSEDVNKPAPMFRKTFKTDETKKIESARLYVTSLGIYDIFFNGKDINPYYAAPGQSVYSQEVYYRTYDIAEYVENGENAVGIMLGHGRYNRAKGKWGDTLALYAQIVIHYQDGTKQIIGTDESWSVCTDGPIRNDDIYNGEFYNASYEQNGWAEIGFEEKEEYWEKAEIHNLENNVQIKAVCDNGIRCLNVINPVSVEEPVEGVFVYDFGQNFNGVCRLKLSGKAGETVIMRHAEYINKEKMLEKDDEVGTIWTRNLLAADNTDYYIFKEDGEVEYSPTFSYRGFRYLQITGIEEAIPLENIEGLLLSTDNIRNGYFECSDQNMNRLYDAIYLSQLSNYVDIPTDCPQRDERLGWTGDAQVFAYTGALNANVANFMYKYIDMLRVSQNDDGIYPQIVPYVKKAGGANGWSDAGIILVWEMYQQYGNKQIIEENITAMCRYMDYLVETSEGFIRKNDGYNDYLALSEMDDACCNTAQCVYVADLLTKMCNIVGEKELEEKYSDIYEKYLQAWRTSFLNEDGSIGQWTQSEYVIALAYGLYPKELEEAGAEKLNISVGASDYHVATGYIATPHILSVLTKYGYKDTAYKMIQQTGYPSWNYMLENCGSLTEGWYSLLNYEDGTQSAFGSFNHVALGSVGQWFYTDVLGIRRDENNPGYKHFYLEPQIGGGLTYAKGSYDSIYGNIESSWEVMDESVKFRFVIPANTSATMTLPSEEYQNVELESGEYEFEVRFE